MALSKATEKYRVVFDGNITAQNGMTLIVVLLFLVLITGISVWGVKQSIFSENIARNQLDHGVAREAAETALRDAERDLMNPSSATVLHASCNRGAMEVVEADFTTECSKGLCVMDESVYKNLNWSLSTGGEVWWPTNKGGRWNNTATDKPNRSPVGTSNCGFNGGVLLGTYTGATALKGVARQPEYVVEYFRRKNVRINLAETQVSSTGRNANQWSPMYRVTARGFGLSGSTQVILQTVVFP